MNGDLQKPYSWENVVGIYGRPKSETHLGILRLPGSEGAIDPRYFGKPRDGMTNVFSALVIAGRRAE